MRKENDPFVIPTILRILQESACVTGDIVDVFLSGYADSYRKAKKGTYSSRLSPRAGKDWGDRYIESQKVYKLLYYLKKQGLIRKDDSKGRKKTRWFITGKGKEKLAKRVERTDIYLPRKDKVFRVIIFDVPEAKKKDRIWLREILRRLGFSLLQKSVWVGKRALPEEFFFDLKKHSLLPHVHIFEVEKEGSIIHPDIT